MTELKQNVNLVLQDNLPSHHACLGYHLQRAVPHKLSHGLFLRLHEVVYTYPEMH